MQLKLKVHDLKECHMNKKRWVLGGGGATEIDLIDVQECELIL